MLWTKGYFETVASRLLEVGDLLEHHCFRNWTGSDVDQHGNKLAGPVEPCGDWVLSSYRRLDDLISDALGMTRAPD